MYGYGYGYYSMFDPTMILVLIGVFLSLGASAKVKSTYARFSRVRSMTGMTGAEAARQLLIHRAFMMSRSARWQAA